MAGSRKLAIEIIGDASGLAKALGKAEDETGKFESSMSSIGKKVALSVGAVVSVGEAFSFMKGAAKDAAEDQSQQKLFEQSLKLAGGSQQVLDAFNDQIDAGMRLKGFTDTDLRDAYAQAFTQSKDVAQSQRDVALAMDIARKTGKPLNTVMDALSKAHNGQTRALQMMLPEFGGLITSAGSTEEALAALEVATHGSADAWASTTEGQMARAGIAFGELKEQIGSALLPVLTKLAEWLTTTVIPAFQQMADWVQENWPQIRDTITDAVAKVWGYVEPVIETMQAAWRQFGDNVLNWMGEKLRALRDVFQGAFDVIMGVFRFFHDLFTGKWSELGEDLKQIVGGIGQLIKGAFESMWADLKLVVGVAWEAIELKVKEGLDALIGAIASMPGKIASAAVGMFDGIKEAFRGAINWIISGWNGLEFKMPAIDTHIPGVGKVGGFTVGVPDIPKLAAGGVVSSPTLALIGEAGPEAVVPLDRFAGDGDTHVHFHGEVIDQRAAEWVYGKLIEMQRRNGPLSLRIA